MFSELIDFPHQQQTSCMQELLSELIDLSITMSKYWTKSKYNPLAFTVQK